MIAVAVFTGVRRTELYHILVKNLKVKMGGEWCLKLEALPDHVKSSGHEIRGRGIPWGELEGCLDRFVDPWLEEAGIRNTGEDDNFVFLGIKGKTKIMPGPLSLPVLGARLKHYPLTINGVSDYLRPHALRRTYAQSQKEAGVKIEDIARNMGHKSIETTFKSYLLDDMKSRRGRYAMPEGFLKVMDRKAKEKQARSVPWVPKDDRWTDEIMRKLESTRDGWFYLREMTSGTSRGQQVNISIAATKLKAEGKIKKWRMQKPGGGLRQKVMVSLPEGRHHPHMRDWDDAVVPSIALYPEEVD